MGLKFILEKLRNSLSLLYSILPFKSTIFKLLTLIYSPNQNIYKHLHFKGKYTVKINSKSSFNINHFGFQLENDIFWSGLYGSYEKDSLRIWTKLCQNSKVVFDIGANTGVYSLIAKAINNSNTVHAFDPVKRGFEKLT